MAEPTHDLMLNHLVAIRADLERLDERFRGLEARAKQVETTTHAILSLLQGFQDNDNRHDLRLDRLERRISAVEEQLRGH